MNPSHCLQIVSNHIVIRHVQSGVHLCCTMLAVTFIYNKNRMVWPDVWQLDSYLSVKCRVFVGSQSDSTASCTRCLFRCSRWWYSVNENQNTQPRTGLNECDIGCGWPIHMWKSHGGLWSHVLVAFNNTCRVSDNILNSFFELSSAFNQLLSSSRFFPDLIAATYVARVTCSYHYLGPTWKFPRLLKKPLHLINGGRIKTPTKRSTYHGIISPESWFENLVFTKGFGNSDRSIQ